jgi:hypothetical protein
MVNLLNSYFGSLSRSYEDAFVSVDARYLHHVFGDSIWQAPTTLRMLQHNTPTCVGERILAFVEESHHAAHPPFFGTHGFYFDAGAGSGETPRIKGFLSYRQLAAHGAYEAAQGRVKIGDFDLSDHALCLSAEEIAIILNKTSAVLQRFFEHENWLPDPEIWRDYLYDDRKRWMLDAFSKEELIHQIRTDPTRIQSLPDIEALRGRDPRGIIGSALRTRRKTFGDPSKFGKYVSQGYPLVFTKIQRMSDDGCN